jgi:hypothetical protein
MPCFIYCYADWPYAECHCAECCFLNVIMQSVMVQYISMVIIMVILTLHLLGLEFYNKLVQYISLPPCAHVTKLLIMVIYCHSKLIVKEE